MPKNGTAANGPAPKLTKKDANRQTVGAVKRAEITDDETMEIMGGGVEVQSSASAAAPLSASMAQPSDAAVGPVVLAALASKSDELQGAYQQLLLSFQQAETAHAKMEAPLRAKIAALEGLVTALRAENSALKGRLESEGPVPIKAIEKSQFVIDLKASQASATAAVANLTNQLEASRAELASVKTQLAQRSAAPAVQPKMVSFFKALTAMDVTITEDTVDSTLEGVYQCSTLEPGSGALVQFELAVFQDEAENVDGAAAAQTQGSLAVEYTPGSGCEAHLPSFLHAPILFGLEQLPMFLAKVTEALRHMKYDGDAQQNGAEEAQAQAAGKAGGPQPACSPIPSAIKAVLTPGMLAEDDDVMGLGHGAGSGTPTVTFQPFQAQALHSAGGARAGAAPTPMEVVSGQGVLPDGHGGAASIEFSGRTPAVVRRAAAQPLATPAAGLAGLASPAGLMMPPASGIKYAAVTPGMAAGSRAPANTPGEAVGMAMMQDEAGQGAGAGASISAGAPAAPPSAGPTPRYSMADANAKIDEAVSAVNRTVETVNKRTTRAAARATAVKAPGSAAKPGRKSVGHVVGPEGFLHTRSPQ